MIRKNILFYIKNKLNINLKTNNNIHDKQK